MECHRATPSFVGIDISKDRLDIHVVPSGRTFTAQRDSKGLEQLTGDLRQLGGCA
jgi:transposase